MEITGLTRKGDLVLYSFKCNLIVEFRSEYDTYFDSPNGFYEAKKVILKNSPLKDITTNHPHEITLKLDVK